MLTRCATGRLRVWVSHLVCSTDLACECGGAFCWYEVHKCFLQCCGALQKVDKNRWAGGQEGWPQPSQRPRRVGAGWEPREGQRAKGQQGRASG